MITVEGLKKSYVGKSVLHIESLQINSGDRVAITGANGSGKTTFLQLLLDLIKPDEGRISLFGHNVQRGEAWKLKTAAFLNDSFLIEFLTVREYLYFLANNVSDQQIHEMIERLSFSTLNLYDPIGNLSSGNKKKVGILGTLLVRRDLIVLDEVCNYLDHQSKMGLLEYLRSLKDGTVVIVEHNVAFMREFATKIVVLDKGSISKIIDMSAPHPDIENLIFND